MSGQINLQSGQLFPCGNRGNFQRDNFCISNNSSRENTFFELTTFKITFRDRIVVRERRFRALVLQKGIRLFDHSKNNLTC
jgi:hypothetical protein